MTPTSPTGYPVLIGRNARDNDRLLAGRHAAHALWIHAADGPSAHVFLEATAPPTAADVAFAAAFIKGVVIVASVWDVEKPRYAKAGQVRVKSQ